MEPHSPHMPGKADGMTFPGRWIFNYMVFSAYIDWSSGAKVFTDAVSIIACLIMYIEANIQVSVGVL